MRAITHDGSVDWARVALLLSISIGLGIALDEVFFVVGAAIAVGALIVGIVYALQKHAEHARLAHQHR